MTGGVLPTLHGLYDSSQRVYGAVIYAQTADTAGSGLLLITARAMRRHIAGRTDGVNLN